MYARDVEEVDTVKSPAHRPVCAVVVEMATVPSPSWSTDHWGPIVLASKLSCRIEGTGKV
jgi:hypothetical protein